MNLLLTILIGIAAGTMVELLLPGHRPGELLLAVLLGSAGALLSRYIGELAGWFGPEDSASFVAALAGSIGLLILYGLAFRRPFRRNR